MSWREISIQIDDWNADWRDELATQRAADRADIYDDRPTRAEIEADEADWRRRDPWPDVQPKSREWPPTPTEPPF